MDRTTVIIGVMILILAVLLVMNYQKANRVLAETEAVAMTGTGTGGAEHMCGVRGGSAGNARMVINPPSLPTPTVYARSDITMPINNLPQPDPYPNSSYRATHPLSEEERQDRLVMYYTEWCGYSQQFKPIWQRFLQEVQPDVITEAVECDQNKELCKARGVKGYPTVILHKSNGTNVEFTGPRSVEGLNDFLRRHQQ
jgi:thiol-disulfide isomerase/thioredoxin